jgi:hypothetical protein
VKRLWWKDWSKEADHCSINFFQAVQKCLWSSQKARSSFAGSILSDHGIMAIAFSKEAAK